MTTFSEIIIIINTTNTTTTNNNKHYLLFFSNKFIYKEKKNKKHEQEMFHILHCVQSLYLILVLLTIWFDKTSKRNIINRITKREQLNRVNQITLQDTVILSYIMPLLYRMTINNIWYVHRVTETSRDELGDTTRKKKYYLPGRYKQSRCVSNKNTIYTF